MAMQVNKRITEVQESATLAMDALAKKMKADGIDVVNFGATAFADLSFGTSANTSVVIGLGSDSQLPRKRATVAPSQRSRASSAAQRFRIRAPIRAGSRVAAELALKGAQHGEIGVRAQFVGAQEDAAGLGREV